MNVINKLFPVIFLLAIVALFFAYYTPTISSKDTEPSKYSDSEKIDYNNTVLNKNESPKDKPTTNIIYSQGDDIDLADINNAKSENNLEALIGSWSPYLDKNSEEYKYLLDKYKDSEGKVIVDGGNAYIANKINENIEIVKITNKHIDLTMHEPLSVHGAILEQLNDLKGYGDWSYGAEVTARNIFSEHFKQGDYSINTIQCREKTCLIEFSFSDFNFAVDFVDELRANRNKCQCIPAETIWPDLKLAVLKLDLI
ncbi:MAG: hypothetical protein KKB00_03830 [Gammaproteobacteria bacterium]|jgi:hypothetical protein|nr:hypothetical protein [Gammaproteobacteria bacterium]